MIAPIPPTATWQEQLFDFETQHCFNLTIDIKNYQYRHAIRSPHKANGIKVGGFKRTVLNTLNKQTLIKRFWRRLGAM